MAAVLRTRRRRLRFRPDRASVLFVGESPPAGGDFFYDGDSRLYRATREAFREAYGSRAFADEGFLDFFKSLGCYLEDLSEAPLNGIIDADERRDARARCRRSLGQRIRRLAPEVVIVVVKDIQGDVRAALEQFHIGATPVFALPFPGPYWRSAYVSDLASLLKRLSRRSILPTRTQLRARRILARG